MFCSEHSLHSRSRSLAASAIGPRRGGGGGGNLTVAAERVLLASGQRQFVAIGMILF